MPIREALIRIASEARSWKALLLDIEPRRTVPPDTQRYAEHRSAYRNLRAALREIASVLNDAAWRVDDPHQRRGAEYIAEVADGVDGHFDRIQAAMLPLIEFVEDIFPLIGDVEFSQKTRASLKELSALMPDLESELEDRDGYEVEDAAASLFLSLGDGSVGQARRDALISLLRSKKARR